MRSRKRKMLMPASEMYTDWYVPIFFSVPK
jgi:hypothetical protein